MAPEIPTEAWQRGPNEGVPPLLQPVAYALVQAREDLDRLCRGFRDDRLWVTPSGCASLAFHLQHVAGATDRLFTYARGERLSDEQRGTLKAEKEPPDPRPTAAVMLRSLEATVDRALDQLRATTDDSLLQPRALGRAAIPTNTITLLFHAAEHAMRHVGQAIVTARVLETID
jgi:uncharacterized damage-inducible protein DinB